MTIEAVLSQVNEVFNDVLGEDVQLRYETTANDVEAWDSLTHIELVVAIEKHFNIRFTSNEIQHFANVGEMCKSIAERLNGA